MVVISFVSFGRKRKARCGTIDFQTRTHTQQFRECLAPLLVQWGIHPPSSVTETVLVETSVSLCPPLEHSFISADPRHLDLDIKTLILTPTYLHWSTNRLMNPLKAKRRP